MQLIDAPGKLVLPFAASGAKNAIPVASQIGIVAGAASLTDGFPPLTRTPLAAGGVPPSGLDMNGIIYELSAILRWANAGAGYVYDGTFAADSNVGGYPKGARVLRSDGQGYWFNTTDNNTTDPEGAGAVAAGWVPDFTNGVAAVTMTGSNVTLTALEYGKPIIVISGLLTANLNLIFPSIAGKWSVINNTTGAYSVTCKTAAGTGVAVSGVAIIVGDATNIYATSSGITAAQLQAQTYTAFTTGGTTGAFTLTPSPAITAYTAGQRFRVKFNAAGNGSDTINISGQGAKNIKQYNSSGSKVAPIIAANQLVDVEYDGTDVVILDPLPPAGAQINRALLTSGTSWTSPANITASTVFKITLVGGGGGGGGVALGYASGGGGGGGNVIWYISGLSPSTAYTTAIGAAGTGGSVTPTAGTAGGSTSITINGTTVTAGGGGGGGNAPTSYVGGTGGTCTNGTVQIAGQPGMAGGGCAGSVWSSASGGSSLLGLGGTNIGASAQAGSGYGSGGAGGSYYGSNSSQAGGNGKQGAILIEWSN